MKSTAKLEDMKIIRNRSDVCFTFLAQLGREVTLRQISWLSTFMRFVESTGQPSIMLSDIWTVLITGILFLEKATATRLLAPLILMRLKKPGRKSITGLVFLFGDGQFPRRVRNSYFWQKANKEGSAWHFLWPSVKLSGLCNFLSPWIRTRKNLHRWRQWGPLQFDMGQHHKRANGAYRWKFQIIIDNIKTGHVGVKGVVCYNIVANIMTKLAKCMSCGGMLH